MQEISKTIAQYKAQRVYRQEKRNEYLLKFEAVKNKMTGVVGACLSIPQNKIPIAQSHSNQKDQLVGNGAIRESKNLGADKNLQLQSQNLQKQLLDYEQNEQQVMNEFQKQVAIVKQKYISEVQALSERTKQIKKQLLDKMQKIKSSNDAALIKNKEIEAANQKLKQQLNKGEEALATYSITIKKEYEQKINEFEKVFEGSSAKITEMQKEFNEDQLVENTLKNEQLLKSIEESAGKAGETGAVVSEYEELLVGKKQILAQMLGNIEMREQQIKKLGQLEEKIKVIMDKMNQEKKIYVCENQQMTEELIQIKNLLTGVMKQQKE